MPATDPEVAFKDCDVAILVGAIPRREGMERKDLLTQNAKIFKGQGDCLNRQAKKSVKVRTKEEKSDCASWLPWRAEPRPCLLAPLPEAKPSLLTACPFRPSAFSCTGAGRGQPCQHQRANRSA